MLFHRRNGNPRRGRSPARPEDALGIGVLYHASLPAWLHAHLDLVDYVEVVPDAFWTDRGPGSRPRFVELPSSMAVVDWLASRRPLVLHASGLSLGSAGVDDPEYRDHLAAWSQRYDARWVGDHLSYRQVRSVSGRVHHAALALPVAYDAESLDLVAARVRTAQGMFGVPLLVENSASYLELAEAEMSEAAFLNAVAERTGCGLLLDLHNVHVLAGHRGRNAERFLDELDLGAVLEVHVAGGGERGSLELLEKVVPRARFLRGVTLEVPASGYAPLQADGLAAGLERARALWPEA